VFTGSRSTGKFRLGSDYDFVVEYSEPVIAFIETLRMFRATPYPGEDPTPKHPLTRDRLDKNTHSVFARGKRDVSKVDIVVVYDLKERLHMADYVNRNYSRAEQKRFSLADWNRMYTLAAAEGVVAI